MAFFEGDWLHVVQSVQGKKYRDDILCPIVFDILHMLDCNSSLSVRYVNREANYSAHCLAKLSCNSTIDSVWMEEYPEGILSTVIVDKSRTISLW